MKHIAQIQEEFLKKSALVDLPDDYDSWDPEKKINYHLTQIALLKKDPNWNAAKGDNNNNKLNWHRKQLQGLSYELQMVDHGKVL